MLDRRVANDDNEHGTVVEDRGRMVTVEWDNEQIGVTEELASELYTID